MVKEISFIYRCIMSFPPRIKYGVNSSGNPDRFLRKWIPASEGMTPLNDVFVSLFKTSKLLLSLWLRYPVRWRQFNDGIVLRRTCSKACIALDAFLLINDLDSPLLVSRDSFNRTGTHTGIAPACALLREDVVCHKGLAHQCRAASLFNVSFIFLPEISQCCEHRIGCGSAQATE